MSNHSETRWDGCNGPYTYNEFVAYHGADAAAYWWSQSPPFEKAATLMDGNDGPYTWDEFLAYYGYATAAWHWDRCAGVQRFDGGKGPYTWPDFEAYYGAGEGASRWRAGKQYRPKPS